MRAPVEVVKPERYTARQAEVLDVVEAVLLREGVRGVRIGELAAEASCSRSTLYELAPTRDELLLLVLDRLLRRTLRRGAEAIERAPGPVERVRAMMVTGALDLAALGPRFLEAVREHPPAQRLFERRLEQGRDVLEELIADAMREGCFRPVQPRVVAEAVIAIVVRFTDPQARPARRATSAADLGEMVDVLIEGLRAR